MNVIFAERTFENADILSITDLDQQFSTLGDDKEAIKWTESAS